MSTLPSGPFPPQVPLFKATQYFANVLDLADLIAALIYEQLPSQSFKPRSGQTFGSLTQMTELSIAKSWKLQYKSVTAPDTKLSLFWQTVYDAINSQLNDWGKASFALDRLFFDFFVPAIDEANDDPSFHVFLQLQLDMTEDYVFEGDKSELRQFLTYDQFIIILNLIYHFRTTLSQVLNFRIPNLSFQYPFDDKSSGWELDVDAVIVLQLPSTSEKFLTWSINEKGFGLSLHLDSISLDDASGLAVVNKGDDNHGETRFPFGGSLGDVTLMGVVITLRINGELAKEDKDPAAPYHRLRQAYFTERDHDNLVDIELKAASVTVGLNNTVLTALATVLGVKEVTRQLLEDLILNGLESLDDFGDTGKTINDSLLTPLLPGASALSKHDLFEPFLDKHSAFTYDALFIQGAGRGIYILNNAPEAPPIDEGGGGIHYPPTDGLPDPPIYDHADPLPSSIGNGRSPFDDLILAEPRRSSLKARLDTMTGLPPEQEAAARLWLDGFAPKSMAWLQERNVDTKAGTVFGKPASPKTIASLGRLMSGNGSRQHSFVFSSAATVRPAPGTMLALAASPLKLEDLPDPQPSPAPPGVQYAKDSTLASSKGSKVDPFWAGISINAVALQQIYVALHDSDALVQSGNIGGKGSELPFQIEPLASPSWFIDLDGSKDRRPIANITGLVIRVGDPVQSTYLLEITCPMEVVMRDRNCLPDDTLSTIAQNRGCLEKMTAGKFTDKAYLDLLYRYFYFLQFVSAEAAVTKATLTHGTPITSPDKGDPSKKPGPPDPTGGLPDLPPVTLPSDTALLTDAIRSTLSQVLPIPVAFDPYHDQSATLEDYEAKGGWLNIYETYQGFPQ